MYRRCFIDMKWKGPYRVEEIDGDRVLLSGLNVWGEHRQVGWYVWHELGQKGGTGT